MDIVAFLLLMFLWESDHPFWILVEKYILHLISNLFHDKLSGNMPFIRWNRMSSMSDIYSRYSKIKVWITFWSVFSSFVLLTIKISLSDLCGILHLISLISVFSVFHKFHYINYKLLYRHFFVINLLFTSI